MDQSQDHRCERGTSPLRLVTPAKSANDRKISSAFVPTKQDSLIRLPSLSETSRQSHRISTSMSNTLSRGKTPLV